MGELEELGEEEVRSMHTDLSVGSMAKVVICTLTNQRCIYPLCRMRDYFTSTICPYAQLMFEYGQGILKECDGRE